MTLQLDARQRAILKEIGIELFLPQAAAVPVVAAAPVVAEAAAPMAAPAAEPVPAETTDLAVPQRSPKEPALFDH